MRKLYIGYDYNNSILGILLAESQEKAEIYWAGADIPIHRTEELDPSDTTYGIHGVVCVMSTKEYRKADIDHKPYDYTFRVPKRGKLDG